MLKQLKAEFHREGIDITQLPFNLDSGYVSQELRNRLHQLGVSKIIIAGKAAMSLRLRIKSGMPPHGKKSWRVESFHLIKDRKAHSHRLQLCTGSGTSMPVWSVITNPPLSPMIVV